MDEHQFLICQYILLPSCQKYEGMNNDYLFGYILTCYDFSVRQIWMEKLYMVQHLGPV
jgi:hypothetical protein